MIVEQGVLSPWRGLMASCLKHFPQQALTIAIEFQLQKLLAAREERKMSVFMQTWVAGGLASLVANGLVYPFDYSQTRLMADSSKPRTFRGSLDLFTQTFKSEGLAACYKGFSIMVYGAFLQKALLFAIHDASIASVRKAWGFEKGKT